MAATAGTPLARSGQDSGLRTKTVLGLRINPITQRRLAKFRANRRGYWSFWIFVVLFILSLFANLIANDRPLVVRYEGDFYFPILFDYPETTFGGEFATNANYRDGYVYELIEEGGWAIWPLVPFSYRTINYCLETPAPAPPWLGGSLEPGETPPPESICHIPSMTANWLGTDDQGRDVLARVIYGYRLSVIFGLLLTGFSSVVGIASGAAQGYFGGLVDLIFQRFLEIWSSMPVLYLLIIMASIITPGFWPLLGLLLLFSWMALVGVVRAEFLRARNFEYVRAAKALGLADRVIIFRHVLPNAMVASVTFMPFILIGSVTQLTALDFLGLGLPPGSPSLGELVLQGKSNLQAPWLGFTSFFTLFIMLSLVVFTGEAVRDGFDPRKAAGPITKKDSGPAAASVQASETRAAAE